MLLALAALSIGINALGAYRYDGAWDGLYPQVPGVSRGRHWTWRRGQLAHEIGRLADAVELRFTGATTSADGSAGLAARYAAPSTPATTVAGGILRLPVSANNTGTAAWVPQAPEARGVVRLGWSWLQEGVEVPSLAGGEALFRTVFPGDWYRFDGYIQAPAEPGRFTLRVGLSREGEAFAERGVAPLELAVEVVR